VLAVASVAMIITSKVKKIAFKNKIGSFPNERMVHTGFIPRLGGLGIYGGFLFGILICYIIFRPLADFNSQYIFILIGTLAIVAIGVYDDFKGLNAPRKFLGQFIAASLVIFSGCTIDVIINPFGADVPLGLFAIPVTYLWIIGLTNAVNLLDGLDGLAAGVSFIVALVFVTMGFLNENPMVVIFGISLAAAIIGFLKYNYHPASIFMGDTGSLALGGALGTIAVATKHEIVLAKIGRAHV